jgi:UDPglucose 6-dehydrogenase
VLVQKLRSHISATAWRRTFALWGLAFKPNTDDMREAPSRIVIDALLAQAPACAPTIRWRATRRGACMPTAARRPADVLQGAYEAAQGAEALLIATEWKEFRSPDYDRLKSLLLQPLIFDGRNLYDPALMQRLGFEYFAIGRGRVPQASPRRR